MKKTMNKRDVAKFHKFLNNDVKIEKISKFLGIATATLKKFTPDALKKALKDKGVKTSATQADDKKAAEKPAEKEADAKKE